MDRSSWVRHLFVVVVFGSLTSSVLLPRHPNIGLGAAAGEPDAARAEHVVHQAAHRKHRPAADQVRAAGRDGVLRL